MCFFPFCFGAQQFLKLEFCSLELCAWDLGLGREQIFLSKL